MDGEKIPMTDFLYNCNKELKYLYELMGELKRGIKTDVNIRSEEDCRYRIQRLKSLMKYVYEERHKHGKGGVNQFRLGSV